MKNNLKTIREAKGLSVQKLADLLNTNRSQIYKLENGERRMTTDWLERIAKALDCQPTNIISDEILPKNPRDQAVLALFHSLSEDEQDKFIKVIAAFTEQPSSEKNGTSG